MSSGEKVLQQPAHLIRLLAGGAIRVENGDFLYCFSPTGNNGVSRLCTRVLNDIAHIRGAACHLPLKGKALSTAEVRSSFLKKRPQEKSTGREKALPLPSP